MYRPWENHYRAGCLRPARHHTVFYNRGATKAAPELVMPTNAKSCVQAGRRNAGQAHAVT